MEIPDRDPRAFFDGLRLLVTQGRLPKTPLHIVLRASGKEALYTEQVKALGLSDIVSINSRISRAEAIQEMKAASGLLLFQGKHCNRQIPAKAYEYLFSRKPMIGLLHADGDTQALVQGEWKVPYCADMDNPQNIADTIAAFAADFERGAAYVPPTSLHDQHSRRTQALKLGDLLDECAA
jgi:hypothetical protein